MGRKDLPLKMDTVAGIFLGNGNITYEIPIYQRNYAWEKDEIQTLIRDVYDMYEGGKNMGGDTRPYYIGTLVTFHKGDQIYEVIDGQQRLTTIRLILSVFGDVIPTNRITYKARKKADETLKAIRQFEDARNSGEYNVDSMPRYEDEYDHGIDNGFRFAREGFDNIVPEKEREGFKEYFLNNVCIVHYDVPKDIDLNHYFEVMNSRGEQLEKHEIVKAWLMGNESLSKNEKDAFSYIWERCSDMEGYIQQNFRKNSETIFGGERDRFLPTSFSLIVKEFSENKSDTENPDWVTIADILDSNHIEREQDSIHVEKNESFQPIIDFPNFLLIVLKITRLDDPNFQISEIRLDDKELLIEFDKIRKDAEKIRKFIFNLLKARFLLDNYIVHHSKEEDSNDRNPWELQVYHQENRLTSKRGLLRNTSGNLPLQERLVHLLSMFEVSFTARQRKNYLFYCLLYLIQGGTSSMEEYADFVEGLADRYFHEVYMDASKLNAINAPLPGSFDEVVICQNRLNDADIKTKGQREFVGIYGDGTEASKGVPLYVFNYLDYKIWRYYEIRLRGNKTDKNSPERIEFFGKLGCEDFELDVFRQFYFSRTRRSLEHYYPQSLATGEAGCPDKNQINCFGNYAMIGSEANSAGSNWGPKTKIERYLDFSKKINRISVASLKFWIMMRVCGDKGQWNYGEIKEHQAKMMDLIFGQL